MCIRDSFETVHNGAVESTVCRQNCSKIARARISCERVFAWSARACDSRAVVAADRRLDRIIVHGF
eukprot:4318944-Lingulodinium_polyedra.AAC.1